MAYIENNTECNSLHTKLNSMQWFANRTTLNSIFKHRTNLTKMVQYRTRPNTMADMQNKVWT